MQTNFTTPDWVKNAVFYQIFPDRFAKSDRVTKPDNLEDWDSPPTVYGFKGGDLLGVVEHLDYLQDLGINAIYFNPIFQSASNHRYHTHDYYRVDPILGGDQAFRTLLNEAHQRSIRIVLDGVFNHASRGFFQFNHIMENGTSSPYLDWFLVKNFPLNAYEGAPNYECWVDLPALPKFNTDNPKVRSFIFDVTRYWLDQGIDGWRLDVPYEIKDDAFWQEFRQLVKSINPDAYIVGEVAWEAQHWLQGDQFDAVMNYQFTQACLGFFAGERIDLKVEDGFMGLPPTRILGAPAFAHRAEELLNLYPQQAVLVQLNLLSSHDMPRFISLAGGDQASQRLATLFQMTYPGAPCIYYGDEIGMQGGASGYPEASRHTFPWDETRWDQELRQYFKTCISLRHNHTALRTGNFKTIYTEGQVYAYLRHSDEETLLVIVNNGTQSYPIDFAIDANMPERSHWRYLLGEGDIRVSAGRLTGTPVAPRSGVVISYDPF